MEKCNKYESLFIFADQAKLEEHLAVCAECREQHEKMQQTAIIAKEVAPHYKHYGKYNVYSIMIKAAAGVFVVVLAYFAVSPCFNDHIAISSNDSVISEMGLPTDDYGLLTVN